MYPVEGMFSSPRNSTRSPQINSSHHSDVKPHVRAMIRAPFALAISKGAPRIISTTMLR
jgi:hypothetical protein